MPWEVMLAPALGRVPAPTAAFPPMAPISPAGNAQNTLAQPIVWLTIALTTVVCIMPVVAFRFLKLDLKPELSDTVSAWGTPTSRPAVLCTRQCQMGLAMVLRSRISLGTWSREEDVHMPHITAWHLPGPVTLWGGELELCPHKRLGGAMSLCPCPSS